MSEKTITIYRGFRDKNEDAFVTRNDEPLNMRNDVRNHSPDGPEWGYNGSGPAQLALAILCDHFGGKETLRAEFLYQEFKDAVISRIHREKREWVMTDSEVANAVRLIEERRPELVQRYEVEKTYRKETDKPSLFPSPEWLARR